MSAREQIVHSGLPVHVATDDVAQGGDRPNILLICMDQLRSDFLGVYGHPICQTPHMDSLAMSGVRFDQAMSECPVCCPARRILMTGLDPFGIHMFQNRDTQDFPEGPKVAEVLSAGGYQTYATGKMHTWPPRNRMGFDDIEVNEEGRTAGLTYPDDYQQAVAEAGYGRQLHAHGLGNNQYGYRPSPVPEPLTTTGWTADRAMRFLRRRDPGKPFFLYVSFDKPHPPITPPVENYELYRDKVFPEPVVGDWVATKFGKLTERVRPDEQGDCIQESLRAYAASVTHIDCRIGQLLGTLRETGVLKNTWIIITADHGDMMFDHNRRAKGTFLSGSCSVPYIIVPPVSAAGKYDPSVVGRVDQHPVGLKDLAPTIADIAGLTMPETIPGRSLLSIIKEPEAEWQKYVFGVCSSKYGVHNGRYRYQWEGVSGDELLFDQLDDPKDLHDLADDPAFASVKSDLRQALIAWLEQHDDIHIEKGQLVTVPVRLVGDVSKVGYTNSPWNNRGWRG